MRVLQQMSEGRVVSSRAAEIAAAIASRSCPSIYRTYQP